MYVKVGIFDQIDETSPSEAKFVTIRGKRYKTVSKYGDLEFEIARLRDMGYDNVFVKNGIIYANKKGWVTQDAPHRAETKKSFLQEQKRDKEYTDKLDRLRNTNYEEYKREIFKDKQRIHKELGLAPPEESWLDWD